MAIISISDSYVNSADQILVADSNSKIPAKDGSQITVLNATNIASGTIASARLDTGTTANKLVLLDGSGNLPAVDASLLTGIVSATISASDPTLSTNPSGGVGTEWNNSTSGEMYICTDATAGSNVWKNVGVGSDNIKPAVWYGARGVFGGGYPYTNEMEYITIATTGNTTDFGDLLHSSSNKMGAYSGDGRGCFFGGTAGSAPSDKNVIQYITIASVGNAIDFGDLTTTLYGPGGLSDGSRGVKFGGGSPANGANVIDYVTIATPGNAIDFGDMLVAYNRSPDGLSNGTYGLMAMGNQSSMSNVIEKITVVTTGNSVDWADLNAASKMGAALGGDTRGLWLGGYSTNATNAWHNVIQYITTATQANCIDFGDLTISVANSAGVTDATKGVIGGGDIPASSNVIQYVTIATPGNATDFGDLSTARTAKDGVSG